MHSLMILAIYITE